MLASLMIQKEDYAGALPVVKRMVNMFPEKKAYWSQLSGIYLTQEDYVNALVVLEFANYGGMLTEDREIRQLADLYMLQEIPHRAAVLMESAIAEGKVEKDASGYEKLANSWIAAREFEKAIPVLGQAAALSDDGEIYKRAGQVQMQLSDWEGSIESFEDALEKGGLRDEAEVQYLLGYAFNELDRYNEAKTWLQRAARDPDHRENANNLIQFIDATTAN
jgi:tetratricopeptide (TPR) repeat protein